MGVRDESRDRLLEAGLLLLSSSAVGGVQKLLTPGALEEVSRAADAPGTVSRHTAYRLGDRSEVLKALVEHVAEKNTVEAQGLLSKVVAATGSALQALERSDVWVVDLDYDRMKGWFRDITRVTFEQRIGSTVLVATWALHGAALTSSRLWTGERPGKKLEEVGREILRSRSRFYDLTTKHWSKIFEDLLSLWGRRIKPDHDVEQLVRVINSMYDGFVLQLFVDDELNAMDDEALKKRLRDKIDLACDALFEMVWACSELAWRDPRRDDASKNDDARWLYDEVVVAACRMSVGASPYETIIRQLGEEQPRADRSTVLELFPTRTELTDSVLRRLVAPAGIALGVAQYGPALPLIASLLMRLSRAAEAWPVATPGSSHEPGLPSSTDLPLVEELIDSLTAALGHGGPHPNAGDVARQLVDIALSPEIDSAAIPAALLEVAKLSDD